MFGSMFKNFPAQYVFAGYTIRKGLTSMTTTIDGNIVYDAFSYTYIDNYLSFYILMEDGTYKNMKENVKVNSITGEDLISKHLKRAAYVDMSEYEQYDKTKPYGVFGLRNINALLKKEEEDAKNNADKDISMAVLIGEKPSYTGMEISGIIKRFNERHGCDERALLVPAIKKDSNDEFDSLIGEELDFYDFISNKDADEVVKAVRDICNQIDAVGNKVYETLD